MHRARKRFGQNFLHEQGVIDRIIKSIAPQKNEPIIEIGPGLGALTEPLLAAGARLTAIELDRDLAQDLRQRLPPLNLVEADALKTDFAQLVANSGATQAKIVGNLPYNISTPLIFHLLGFKSHISAMFFMLQKEVVDRMAAQPGTKANGRLGIMTQYECIVTPLFDIAPGAFQPAPKVTSTFVALHPRPRLQHLHDRQLFSDLVNAAFQQRRKTIRNALKAFIPQTLQVELATTLEQRAEDLSVDDFVGLANRLSIHPAGEHN